MATDRDPAHTSNAPIGFTPHEASAWSVGYEEGRRAALAAPPVVQQAAQVISVEDSLRTLLRWERERVEALEDELRDLRSKLPGATERDAAFMGLLTARPAQPAAQASRVWRGGGTLTVADLVNNLLMMDQALPIYGAQYIEHNGRRGPIAVHPTVSRERVADGRWIGEGKELNAAVIWTRAEQPAPQAGAWCSACGCGNDVCGYAHLPGCLRAAQAQGGSNG